MNTLVEQLLSKVLSAVFMVFCTWVGVLIYRNNKLRRENDDLKKKNWQEGLSDIHSKLSSESVKDILSDENKR